MDAKSQCAGKYKIVLVGDFHIDAKSKRKGYDKW